MSKINLIFSRPEQIKKLAYVDFMSLLKETNRPPGGRDSIQKIAINTFLNEKSKVLHIGCNTGSSTRLLVTLTKCSATGLDLSPAMIRVARNITKNESLSSKIRFIVGNAQNLSFKSNYFDLVFSTGAVAFMNKREKIIKNVVKVVKPYGFFADTPMYYYKNPPQKLIEKINSILQIKIQKWNKYFWEKLYEHPNLELSYHIENKLRIPNENDIKNYCRAMSLNIDLPKNSQAGIEKRLLELMTLFAENNKYLKYSIMIYQKVRHKEQISLFGK